MPPLLGCGGLRHLVVVPEALGRHRRPQVGQSVAGRKCRERVRSAARSEQADQAPRARERGTAARPCLPLPGEPAGKMMCPLVRQLAVDAIPVTVTCRCSRSPASPTTAGSRTRSPTPKWLRPTAPTPCSTRTRTTPSSSTGSWSTKPATPVTDVRPDRVADLLRQRVVVRVRQEVARQGQEDRAAGPRRPGPAELRRRRPEPALAHRHHRALDQRRQALPVRGQGRVLQPDRRLLRRLTDEVPPRGRGDQQRSRDASRCR